MRKIVAFVLMTSFIPAAALGAQSSRAMRHNHTGKDITHNYILALSAADSFLQAWRRRDVPSAINLLSTEARKRYGSNQELLELYLSGISNPGHEAYEVWHGRSIDRTHIEFLVRLYEFHTAETWHGTLPPPSRIVLVKIGPWEWKIDRLPYWPQGQRKGHAAQH